MWQVRWPFTDLFGVCLCLFVFVYICLVTWPFLETVYSSHAKGLTSLSFNIDFNTLILSHSVWGRPSDWGASLHAEPKSATWESHPDYGGTNCYRGCHHWQREHLHIQLLKGISSTPWYPTHPLHCISPTDRWTDRMGKCQSMTLHIKLCTFPMHLWSSSTYSDTLCTGLCMLHNSTLPPASVPSHVLPLLVCLFVCFPFQIVSVNWWAVDQH